MHTVGIELDEVARDVFHFRLHSVLHLVPSSGAEPADFWRLAFLSLVFRHLVQRMDRNIDKITVLICDFDHLLHHAVDRHANQSVEAAYAVVYMHHVSSHLKLANFFQRECHLAPFGFLGFEVEFVVAFKNLMVGEQRKVVNPVYESLV